MANDSPGFPFSWKQVFLQPNSNGEPENNSGLNATILQSKIVNPKSPLHPLPTNPSNAALNLGSISSISSIETAPTDRRNHPFSSVTPNA